MPPGSWQQERSGLWSLRSKRQLLPLADLNADGDAGEWLTIPQDLKPTLALLVGDDGTATHTIKTDTAGHQLMLGADYTRYAGTYGSTNSSTTIWTLPFTAKRVIFMLGNGNDYVSLSLDGTTYGDEFWVLTGAPAVIDLPIMAVKWRDPTTTTVFHAAIALA